MEAIPAAAHRLTIAADWRGDTLEGAHQRHLAIWRADQSLRCVVDAPLAGDPAPKGPPGRQWELWEHEVVELFIAGADARYLELEFGPHGHYLVLQLAGERNIVGYDLFVDYQAQLHGDRWRGGGSIPWSLLPKPPHRLNAYAMSGQGEQRRHLALFPLAGKAPDFHQLSSFRPCTIPEAS